MAPQAVTAPHKPTPLLPATWVGHLGSSRCSKRLHGLSTGLAYSPDTSRLWPSSAPLLQFSQSTGSPSRLCAQVDGPLVSVVKQQGSRQLSFADGLHLCQPAIHLLEVIQPTALLIDLPKGLSCRFNKLTSGVEHDEKAPLGICQAPVQ